MKLEIITPDKTLFEGEAILLQVPGYEGSLEILNNHAPLIVILKKGSLRIRENNNKEQSFDVNSGVLEVHDNKILILAE